MGQKAVADLRTNPQKRPVILYDGDCVICHSGMQRVAAVVGSRVEVADFQQKGVLARFPGITFEKAMELPHLIETDGSVYSGLGAVLLTLSTRPAFSMLRQVYDLESVQSWGEWIYRLVADSRYRFMGRDECHGTCAIHARHSG